MKSKLSAFATLMGAILPICCVSCESTQQKEQPISIEVVLSERNIYTCSWEEEITFRPLYVSGCVYPGAFVYSEWMMTSKIGIKHRFDQDFYPIFPMDVIRYSIVATFEADIDPEEYCRKEFIGNEYANYLDEILGKNEDKLPKILVEPLVKTPASIEKIEASRIARRGGKISRIDGKAVSDESLILRESGDKTPLAEATDETIYRAKSFKGEELYFDFDPNLITGYIKFANFSDNPTCTQSWW